MPEQDLQKIETAVDEMKTECVVRYRALKSRSSGPEKLIEMTLIFPEDMTIKQCHDVCDKIEDKIKNALGNCTISIHLEPECTKCQENKS